jgi:hypothetical protein
MEHCPQILDEPETGKHSSLLCSAVSDSEKEFLMTLEPETEFAAALRHVPDPALHQCSGQ